MFSDEDAKTQLSILRAIASSDLHNMVYRADYRIVPAVTANSGTHSAMAPKQRNQLYAELGNPIPERTPPSNVKTLSPDRLFSLHLSERMDRWVDSKRHQSRHLEFV